MATYRYSTQLDNEHTARAAGRDLSISTKASVEICRWLRYRDLQKAKRLLEMVMQKKLAVPYVRFNRDVGHKPGNMTAGRYPYKASKEFFNLLTLVEKNAAFKNLDTENLKIVHLNAHKASVPMHYGRQGARAMKRTHVEVVVAEQKPAKSEVKEKKEVKKEKVEQTPAKKEVEQKEQPKVEQAPVEEKEEPKKVKQEQPKKVEQEKVEKKEEPKKVEQEQPKVEQEKAEPKEIEQAPVEEKVEKEIEQEKEQPKVEQAKEEQAPAEKKEKEKNMKTEEIQE